MLGAVGVRALCEPLVNAAVHAIVAAPLKFGLARLACARLEDHQQQEYLAHLQAQQQQQEMELLPEPTEELFAQLTPEQGGLILASALVPGALATILQAVDQSTSHTQNVPRRDLHVHMSTYNTMYTRKPKVRRREPCLTAYLIRRPFVAS